MSEKNFADDHLDYRLGETAACVAIDSKEQAGRALTQLAAQARHTLHIQSFLLAPEIYDTTAMFEAVSQLARAHRWARVRILVEEADVVVARGHRLLTLSHRLDSHIAIRRINPEHRVDEAHYLIADGIGYAWFESNENYVGRIDFADRVVATRLVERFMRQWENALVDPGLRRLQI